MSIEHTKLPWAVRNTKHACKLYDSQGNVVAWVLRRDYRGGALPYAANAGFIVKACNAYYSVTKQNKRLRELLEMAKCPNCDGSGGIGRKVRDKQYVTLEMALDAGQPELEGILYEDDQYEEELCQWCDEVREALKEQS